MFINCKTAVVVLCPFLHPVLHVLSCKKIKGTLKSNIPNFMNTTLESNNVFHYNSGVASVQHNKNDQSI